MLTESIAIMDYRLQLLDLAPELLHQIFNNLHCISDVLSLSSTCRDLHGLLPAASRLPALFFAAEREFGPLDDIAQLLTYNDSQHVHIKRKPQNSYSLLRQMLSVGKVATKIVDLYPQIRWGDDRYLDRRALTSEECCSVRRAVYRYWLFVTAFQGRTHARGCRMIPSVVEERATLLRNWSSDELVEIEDVRQIVESLISTDICPTDGAVMQNWNEHCDFRELKRRDQAHPFYQQRSWNSWPPDQSHFLPNNFYNDTFLSNHDYNLPVSQRRKLAMTGWGDEISQYYVIESMMKLNPRQIMHLYEKAVTKADVEQYLVDHCDAGEWFWDNGQTWLDTWTLVLYKRGEDVNMIRSAIHDGELGITGSSSLGCFDDSN